MKMKNIFSFIFYLCVTTVVCVIAGFIMHVRILRLNNETRFLYGQQISWYLITTE